MGQVELGRFVNLLTHTEPTKKKLATQPNPTHQLLKVDLTQWVELDWVNLGG